MRPRPHRHCSAAALTINVMACALGMHTGLVGAQATPAAQAGASDGMPIPEPGSAAEAHALVGWEYRLAIEGTRIKPGLSCLEGGGSSLDSGGKEVPGWRAMTFDCDDHVTLALGRERVDGRDNATYIRIVDAVALPGATVSATLHHKPGLAFTGPDNNCKLDGRHNRNLVVTMRRVQREWLTWRNGLVAAWTYDLERGRIVPVPIKRVTCYQELDP